MLGIIALAVGAPVAALLGYAATRPNTFRVERSTTIDAPPEAVQQYITDFRRWRDWSPWEKLDPELKRTYSGAESGTGAAYAWEGRKAGAGRMEIREVAPGSRVVIQLDFTKPFAAHNTAEFTLEPRGRSTKLTWAMYGPSPFVSKLFGVFVNMENLVGKDFAAGLDNLKSLAEGQASRQETTA